MLSNPLSLDSRTQTAAGWSDAGHPADAGRAPRSRTLLELVWSAGEDTHEPDDVVAAVAAELGSGRVRLCGNFRGVSVPELTAELRAEGGGSPEKAHRGFEAGLQDAFLTHYCLHCLSAAHENQAECARCAAPFRGAGRFDLVTGPPPSEEFAFLFHRKS